MRKAEVEVVEKLLHEPAEDAQELAKKIIKALDEHRDRNERYHAIVRQTGTGPAAQVTVIGRYATPSAAERAITSGKLPRMDGTRFLVAPWLGQGNQEAVLDRIDDAGIAEIARKSWKVVQTSARSRKW